jgi:parallel beta-helix repeat protein
VILALAVVGVTLLSGGRALGQQLRCGDTITTDTTLDSDLVDCPNNGIVIGADDITLDLNGHTIGGDGTEFAGCPENEFCDEGVLNDGHDGVTVRDGSVRDFVFGVVVVGARHNRVVDITVSSNDGTGLQLDQGGISLNRSDRNLVKRNALRRNGDLGVFMEKSDHNHIRKNRIGRNPEGGMITEGNANKIVRNRMARNGGGIQITVVNRGTKAVGNVVRGNDVRASRGGGISVDTGPKRTRISRNHVVGSGRDGIDVNSRSTKLSKNRAVRNGDLGIDAVKGVTDGGGNRAHGNGDPRQCVNVKCR